MGYFLIGWFAFFVLGRIAIHWEYNHGRCRKCGGHYKYFDTDSQGNDGYVCDKCGHTVWF